MVEEDIRKITGVITAVTPILERLNRKDSLAKIQERIRQIQNTEVKVLICGEFKRGKSSFVNALIGRNICPVAHYPLNIFSEILFYRLSLYISYL